ncbi:hypothetical protein Ciccas_014146, partial [Cichlidogyrus casuarinus]
MATNRKSVIIQSKNSKDATSIAAKLKEAFSKAGYEMTALMPNNIDKDLITISLPDVQKNGIKSIVLDQLDFKVVLNFKKELRFMRNFITKYFVRAGIAEKDLEVDFNDDFGRHNSCQFTIPSLGYTANLCYCVETDSSVQFMTIDLGINHMYQLHNPEYKKQICNLDS